MMMKRRVALLPLCVSPVSVASAAPSQVEAAVRLLALQLWHLMVDHPNKQQLA
jgi:hypothetical protein